VPDAVSTDLPLCPSLPDLHALSLVLFPLPVWLFPVLSLPADISSNSSHLSHRLLPGPASQAPKPGHQAGAAGGQTGRCLPGHALLCPRRRDAGGSAHHLLLRHRERSHLQPVPRQTASLARTDQGERNCPLTLWGSCEPHAVPLHHSHARMRQRGDPTPRAAKASSQLQATRSVSNTAWPPRCSHRTLRPLLWAQLLWASRGQIPGSSAQQHSRVIFCLSPNFFT